MSLANAPCALSASRGPPDGVCVCVGGVRAVAGAWVDEAPYQATAWFPGAAEARLAHQSKQPLFKSSPTIFVGATTAPAATLRQLVSLLGARVALSPETASIAISKPEAAAGRRRVVGGSVTGTVVEVSEAWLFGMSWSCKPVVTLWMLA